jgi:hypothetical protein
MAAPVKSRGRIHAARGLDESSPYICRLILTPAKGGAKNLSEPVYMNLFINSSITPSRSAKSPPTCSYAL